MIEWFRTRRVNCLKRKLAKLEAERDAEEALSQETGRFFPSAITRLAGEIAETREALRQSGITTHVE